MNKKKDLRKFITLSIMLVCAFLLFNACVQLFFNAQTMYRGFYNSRRFATGIEEILQLSANYINEHDLVHPSTKGEMQLTKEYLEKNQVELERKVERLIEQKEARLEEITNEEYIRKLPNERAKTKNAEEIDRLKNDIQNAEQIVLSEIIKEKKNHIQELKGKLDSRKNAVIQIRNRNEVIYSSGKIDKDQSNPAFDRYYLLIDLQGKELRESIHQHNLEQQVNFLIDQGYVSNDQTFYNGRHHIWDDFISQIEKNKIDDYTLEIQIVKNGAEFPFQDRLASLKSMYKQDLWEDNVNAGTQFFVSIAVLYFTLAIYRKKGGAWMENRNETLDRVTKENLAEQFIDKVYFYIEGLKIELKLLLFVFSWNYVQELLHFGTNRDLYSILRSFVFVGIVAILFVDFLRSEKENYIKNSYFYEWRDKKRKRRFKGLAKGTEMIFDTIHLVGGMIVLSFVMALLSGVIEQVLIPMFFGGLFILYLIRLLQKKLIDERVGYIEEIDQGVQRIMDGDLSADIPVREDNPFANLARNINRMRQGYGTAMEQQMKSERMKTELISNVSHDLKTPLTSIINYVDLLKKEDIEPDYARDYVAILDQKAHRLNVLIQDLFEASRASSGDLALNMEKIDVAQLLHQTLAEMDAKIKDSGLFFIEHIPSEPIYIMADGKKLHRVFDNLIINVLKYSLEGTRVYIDLISGDYARLSIKNISNYEMNFTQEEITQRFIRADKARSSEGSGLGLAIAKSLLELMHMELRISTDGDLFKVDIEMKTIQ